MDIDIREDVVKVSFHNNELKSSFRNQLLYFGYKLVIDNNSYIYDGGNSLDVAIRTYKYFSHNLLDVNASQNLLDALDLENSKKIQFDQLKDKAIKFKNGTFVAKEFKEYKNFLKSLPRKLKEHQVKSSFHHLILRNSADFSVPGSGKTASLLAVYEIMRREGDVNCLFVVGPPSSFTAWKNEFKLTLGRNPTIQILAGTTKDERINNYFDFSNDKELYLTSFQSFANDYSYILNFFSHPNKKVFFIVDEAHYIKQIDGKWASAVLSAGKKAVSRHVLTGTPCPKSYTDLFNIFDFLWGQNIALSEHNKVEITICEKHDDLQTAIEIIKSKLDPLFYRVRKADLGLKPPIFHSPYIVQMNEIEKKIYDSVYKKISELSYFDDTNNILTLLSLKRGRIIRLRQLTSYVKLLITAIDDYSELVIDETDLENIIGNYDKIETPAKIQALIELVLKIREQDRKILIWSNFVESINTIEKHLQKKGFGCNHIYGDTPIIGVPEKDILSREQIIEEFLSFESETDILIANPGACAESISLHKSCHHAIYYDLSYNCAQYLQSLDRIHRVGGSENVSANYYFLQYENTIDDDIYENLIRKRDKMYQVIEYNSDIYNLDIDVYIDENEDENAYDRIFSK